MDERQPDAIAARTIEQLAGELAGAIRFREASYDDLRYLFIAFAEEIQRVTIEGD